LLKIGKECHEKTARLIKLIEEAPLLETKGIMSMRNQLRKSIARFNLKTTATDFNDLRCKLIFFLATSSKIDHGDLNDQFKEWDKKIRKELDIKK